MFCWVSEKRKDLSAKAHLYGASHSSEATKKVAAFLIIADNKFVIVRFSEVIMEARCGVSDLASCLPWIFG